MKLKGKSDQKCIYKTKSFIKTWVFPYEKVISVTLFGWFNAMQSENWVVIFCKGYEKQSQSVKGKL